MTRREANRLAQQIGKVPGVRVTGAHRWSQRGGAGYELVVVDLRTGGTFLVDSRANWEDRVRAGHYDSELLESLKG